MSDELDIGIFDTNCRKIVIGTLTQDVINFLKLGRKPGNILLWDDRFKYIEKHKSYFLSEEDYIKHIKQIPEIIKNPDYLGLHPKDNSIQYIKRISHIMLVGIRIKNAGDLNFRSSYPITEDTLNTYITSNTCWKYK